MQILDTKGLRGLFLSFGGGIGESAPADLSFGESCCRGAGDERSSPGRGKSDPARGDGSLVALRARWCLRWRSFSHCIFDCAPERRNSLQKGASDFARLDSEGWVSLASNGRNALDIPGSMSGLA